MSYSLDAQRFMAMELASRDYAVVLVEEMLSNGKRVWMAYNPDLPGCKSHGGTRYSAKINLRDARAEYIFSLILDGLDVPPPSESAKTVVYSLASRNIVP